MSENTILSRIEELIAEERNLRTNGARCSEATRPTRQVAHIRAEREQLWDLVRRRRAWADIGGDPDAVCLRTTRVVADYARAPAAKMAQARGSVRIADGVLHVHRVRR